MMKVTNPMRMLLQSCCYSVREKIKSIVLNENERWVLRLSTSDHRFRCQALRSGLAMNQRGYGDQFNLTRNIHRIEKGLCFQKRKGVFAEDYIKDTVHLLVEATRENTVGKKKIIWATSVLKKYFLEVQFTHIIKTAYDEFEKQIPGVKISGSIPYAESTRKPLGASATDLYNLAVRRRSVRTFLPRHVDVGIIKKAISIALLSPSACNRQPFQFLYYDDPYTINKLLSIPGGADGLSCPSLFVIVGSYRAFFNERDSAIPFIDSSLSVMMLILALEALDISSVCINWPCLEDREKHIRKVIDIESDEVVIMMIGAGYADPSGLIPFSEKRDVDELLRVNERIK